MGSLDAVLLNAVRFGIPIALILAGFVLLFVTDGATRWDGFAMCVGAGLSVALINVLFRFGARGDEEREAEEEARRFFSEHGHWPDEPPPAGRGASGSGGGAGKAAG
jgi:hypothetical protein